RSCSPALGRVDSRMRAAWERDSRRRSECRSRGNCARSAENKPRLPGCPGTWRRTRSGSIPPGSEKCDSPNAPATARCAIPRGGGGGRIKQPGTCVGKTQKSEIDDHTRPEMWSRTQFHLYSSWHTATTRNCRGKTGMDTLQNFLDTLSGYIWGPYVLIPLLFLTGLYLTIRLGGLQFTRLVAAMNLGIIKRRDQGSRGDITQYQALTTALAATVGTGNIVGVATAIAIGGPGALFWMWVTGLVGMATKYSEAFLAVRFRGTDSAGEKSGGPQYYLERGIKGPLGKVLGISFAVFTVIACFGIGNLTQANAISANVANSWSVSTWVTGLITAVLAMTVLVGGIKSIGRVTAALVPIMILFYCLGGIYILLVNAADVPAALGMVFSDAFTGTSAVGGFAGSAIIIVIQFGVARGLFSNESGLGSAAMAAAAAQTAHPVRQGLVSMTQTFIDTI